jgi:hypothetical protein
MNDATTIILLDRRGDRHPNAQKIHHLFFRGNKGAITIPLYSFQYLRRPGCAAKLLYF